MSTQATLDAASALLREIGHGREANRLTRQHVEFAIAHLREAWISEDGQDASTPGQTHTAVAGFYKLQESIERREASRAGGAL